MINNVKQFNIPVVKATSVKHGQTLATCPFCKNTHEYALSLKGVSKSIVAAPCRDGWEYIIDKEA